MIRILFLFVLTTASFVAFSQSDVVITLKGDTLIGKATISVGTAIQTVRIKNGKDKKQLKVYEIKSLTKKDRLYHPLKINNIYQLGLLVKEGYLSLYKFMDNEENGSHEFSVPILIKKDGTNLIVPNLGFKKKVDEYLDGCDIVATGFSENEYKRSDLSKIIDDYNTCIDENTSQLKKEVVEKNLISTKTTKIKALINDIRDDGTTDDIAKVVEMLNDVKIKFESNLEIPEYLENALRASLKSNEGFTEQLNDILE